MNFTDDRRALDALPDAPKANRPGKTPAPQPRSAVNGTRRKHRPEPPLALPRGRLDELEEFAASTRDAFDDELDDVVWEVTDRF